MKDQELRKLLLDGSFVSEENIKKAEQYAVANQRSLYDALVDLDFITPTLLGDAIAESFGVPYTDLIPNQPIKSVVLELPEVIAKKYRAILWRKEADIYFFATDNPRQPGIKEALASAFPGKTIEISYALTEHIDLTFAHYRFPIKTRLDALATAGVDVAPKLLNEIFDEALIYNASDIHIEPQKGDVRIRFRIDGVLQEVTRIAKELHAPVINLIKVNADLRIDEHLSSQDGAIRYKKPEKKEDVMIEKTIDLRVSILPTLAGEKAVLRILSTYTQSLALREIGLSPDDEKLLRNAIKRPYGMVLVTGPTGSGKTTTLYSLIHILNTPNVNITTIEDPVEYEVSGINQVQVNTHGNLTFDKGLRSIVRQDPNVILVGEIRDLETANVAVNAALTGHLLLSTFHANDAASAIPRLADLGVPPFMIASTLELIATQRLVRTICMNCKQGVTFTQAEVEEIAPGAGKYFPEDTITLYQGMKCEVCSWTGYYGRKAVFEVIKMTPELQDLILTRPSTKQLRELARSQGYMSLFENGLSLVREGQTSLEELARVASAPETRTPHRDQINGTATGKNKKA